MNATINVLGHVGFVRIFEGESGKTVYFSVAVDQRRSGQQENGEKPAPVWYSFRAVNGTAEMLSQYLQKGRLVHVTGVAPRVRTYEVERTLNVPNVGTVKFKDTRQDLEYLVVDIRFVGAPKQESDAGAGAIEAQLITPTSAISADDKTSDAPVSINAEDLPF